MPSLIFKIPSPDELLRTKLEELEKKRRYSPGGSMIHGVEAMGGTEEGKRQMLAELDREIESYKRALAAIETATKKPFR
jgi:hypothetical protein